MKQIKYVIWGAGDYGKRAFYAIGKENVEAFIDTDPKKKGMIYCGKLVIDFGQYKADYSDCLIVIGIQNEDECVKLLDQDDIDLYVSFRNVPSELFNMVGYNELKAYLLAITDGKKNYGIKGFSLYGLLVYQWLSEKNKKIEFILDSNISRNVLKLFDRYEIHYCIERELKNAECDIVFLCEYISPYVLNNLLLDNKKCCYIYNCSKKIVSYYNYRLERLKDIYRGKRCFIVATGPSLKVDDLDRLYSHGEICFSVNRIYEIFNQTKWRPEYYIVSDVKFAADHIKEIDMLEDMVKLIGDQSKAFWEHEHDRKTIKYHVWSGDCCYDFSDDISRVIYAGYTVTYVCMQIAAYMGFQQIYLIGVDCNYIRGSQNNYCVNNGQPDVALHNEDGMLRAYRSAKEYAEINGIEIYNATRGGKLEVFKRINFDDLF